MAKQMTKQKTVYSCQNCGAQSPKWVGKCPDCNQWNTFAEESFSTEVTKTDGGAFFTLSTEKPLPLSEIALTEQKRFSCGITELDRVLGGGVVPGSLVLIGGDPGIGKSTLILQALNQLTKSGVKVLYATGEESAAQVKMRGDRLGISNSMNPSPQPLPPKGGGEKNDKNLDILVVAENALPRILEHIKKTSPQVVVIDSIQTVYLPELESAPGSVSQVRECAGKLLYMSKTTGTATLLIGHVTKEGALAGPRVLEHMVDTVLYFEGDTHQNFRILRTIKNRFGSTNEIGIFEMSSTGLAEVDNPSRLFLSDHFEKANGSVVTASLEGLRPFLVEIQALVSSSSLANPRRTTLGVDAGRVSILVAVLEKVVGLNLYAQDIYVNATGGFKITEPSADLAILCALVSSFRNKPIPPQTLILGEVGLSGEIRGVLGLDIRLKEAEKMGFKKAIIPKTKGFSYSYSNSYDKNSKKDFQVIQAKTAEEVIDILFN